MSWLTLATGGAITVCSIMLLLWFVHFPLKNAAIVDFGWGFNIGLLGAGYAYFGGGFPNRAILLAAMALLWGFRLSFYLLFDRILGHPEEGRYQELRRQWKTNIEAKFLAFYEFQAVLCVVMATPFLLASTNATPEIGVLEWAGVFIWFIGMAGEATADAQLAAFKKANKGRTCQVGLWHYSRHPNYFFEWLIWVGFALFSSGSPMGWLGWISPAMILYFLVRVTGIPATEAQALRSRGDEYRKYQQTTSAFVPWFPK